MHPGDGEVYGSKLPPDLIAAELDELGRAAKTAFGEYRAMGFSPAQALRLARDCVISWVRVKEHLLNGCTLEQALEIWT